MYSYDGVANVGSIKTAAIVMNDHHLRQKDWIINVSHYLCWCRGRKKNYTHIHTYIVTQILVHIAERHSCYTAWTNNKVTTMKTHGS